MRNKSIFVLFVVFLLISSTLLAACGDDTVSDISEEISELINESKEEKIASFTVEQIPGSDIRETLTKAFSEAGMAIAQLRSARLSLEEIFIKLTNTSVSEETEAVTEEAIEETVTEEVIEETVTEEVIEETIEEASENESNI